MRAVNVNFSGNSRILSIFILSDHDLDENGAIGDNFCLRFAETAAHPPSGVKDTITLSREPSYMLTKLKGMHNIPYLSIILSRGRLSHIK